MTLIGVSKTKSFAAAAGSIAGREHRRLGRNNQDAAVIRSEGDRLVAVVTDGCSMGRASEVGAQLGAAWIAGWLLEAPPLPPEVIAARLGPALDRFLGLVLDQLPGPRTQAVADLLLFGFLALVTCDQHAAIYGLGDGLFQIGGERTVLFAKDNAPPYPAYRLLAPAELCGDPRPTVRVHASLAIDCFDRALIATDGAAPLGDELDALLADRRWANNPSLLQRRLNLLGATPGLLGDDTTLIAIRRQRGIR